MTNSGKETAGNRSSTISHHADEESGKRSSRILLAMIFLGSNKRLALLNSSTGYLACHKIFMDCSLLL